jgi:hypothetical protein
LKNYGKTEQPGGQALIELLVVLPVFILFMVAVMPLIVRSVVLPWLDERITLRQLGQDNEQVHGVLLQTHSMDLLPPYFHENSLEEDSRNTPMGISIPLLGDIFPGFVERKSSSTTLPDHGWESPAILGVSQENDREVRRSLSLLEAESMTEEQIPRAVRKLTILGFPTGKTDILGRSGLNLFHSNLDALPETDPMRGKP